MRLASYSFRGRESYGVISEKDGIVDLGTRLEYGTLRELIGANALDAAQELSGMDPDCSLGDISLRLPIPAPEKIICVGINYPEREEEYKGILKRGSYPNLFVRFPLSFSSPGQDIIRPKVSDQLDYEGEIVLVIGKAGRHIPRRGALSHVAGITAANEGTVRDWVNHGTKNITQGKNFERSGSVGPWLVTSDELDPGQDIRVTTKVNEEMRQSDSTKNLLWPFDELLSYISTFITLVPGDLILTGTPVGAGAHMNPPKYLVPGDVVTVEVEGVGILRNKVTDEM